MSGDEPFLSRAASFRRSIYKSLRRSKSAKDKSEFTCKPVSTDNLHVISSSRNGTIQEDSKVERSPCPLVQRFNKEGAIYDNSMILPSFEKKRRNHYLFVADHHARKELFCPEQASQCEMEFLSETHKQFVVYIKAPNGEKSGPIHFHGRGFKQSFSPAKIGCGHGKWRIQIFHRVDTKFLPVCTEEVDIRGAGVLTYKICNQLKIRLHERLWLHWLN